MIARTREEYTKMIEEQVVKHAAEMSSEEPLTSEVISAYLGVLTGFVASICAEIFEEASI